jgi:hypothetical protein
MGLSGQVIDFHRLNLLNNPDKTGRVRQIAVMEDKSTVTDVRILVEVINAIRIKQGRASFDSMDLVIFLEEELGQIRSVLSGDTGDKGYFAHSVILYLI